MDPDATVSAIATALRDGDLEEADYLRGELAAWLERGGFAPDWTTADATYVFNNLFRSHPGYRARSRRRGRAIGEEIGYANAESGSALRWRACLNSGPRRRSATCARRSASVTRSSRATRAEGSP